MVSIEVTQNEFSYNLYLKLYENVIELCTIEIVLQGINNLVTLEQKSDTFKIDFPQKMTCEFNPQIIVNEIIHKYHLIIKDI